MVSLHLPLMSGSWLGLGCGGEEAMSVCCCMLHRESLPARLSVFLNMNDVPCQPGLLKKGLGVEAFLVVTNRPIELSRGRGIGDDSGAEMQTSS